MERPKATIPLNCMDKALFALHSKDEPMVLHWILTINGTVGPVRLKFALMAVLSRCPSLRSTIQAAPLRPVREASLVFTFHHAAVDGVRALRFISEVIREYNGVAERSWLPEQHLSGTDGDQLVARARACRPGVKHFYLKMTASLAYRFLVAPFSPNARIYRTASKPSAEICFCQGSLNPGELRQIRSKSSSVAVKVNDILLAACFRTIEEWNRGYGRLSRKISIMVPVDVGRAVSSPVLANEVSFISVPTTRKERSDPEELIRRVGQKTSGMGRSGMAFSMVYAACFCTHLPPGITKTVARLVTATRIPSFLRIWA